MDTANGEFTRCIGSYRVVHTYGYQMPDSNKYSMTVLYKTKNLYTKKMLSACFLQTKGFTEVEFHGRMLPTFQNLPTNVLNTEKTSLQKVSAYHPPVRNEISSYEDTPRLAVSKLAPFPWQHCLDKAVREPGNGFWGVHDEEAHATEAGVPWKATLMPLFPGISRKITPVPQTQRLSKGAAACRELSWILV